MKLYFHVKSTLVYYSQIILLLSYNLYRADKLITFLIGVSYSDLF